MKNILEWIGAAFGMEVGLWILGEWNPVEVFKQATFDCEELRAELVADHDCLRSANCMMTREELSSFETRTAKRQKYCADDEFK